MQDPNYVAQETQATPSKEFKNNLQIAIDKLKLSGSLNGKVVKPFKATGGKRELFVRNEEVVVTARTLEDTKETFYIVNGLTYNHKTGRVRNKSAQFTDAQLLTYVSYNR